MLNVTHGFPSTQSAFSTQKWIMVKLTLPREISLSLARMYWIHSAPIRLYSNNYHCERVYTLYYEEKQLKFYMFLLPRVNYSSRAPRTSISSTEKRIKLRLIYRLIRSLWAFTPWYSKDITKIGYGFTVDSFFVFTA